MSTTPPEAAPSHVPREGDVLAGKYRIEKVLGQGGMGVVVAAQHVALRQKVALKFLLPEAVNRAGACERFLREARAAVSIQSEHIVKVMDVGTLETGAPYMVMEFLTGSDLGVVLAERGVLPVAEAIGYILQASEAIAEAHANGIIHRDLKPPNLFLTRRVDGSPFVKVLDFGLSKVTAPESLEPSLTAANVVMGSPSYMSPEQIRSFKGLDARTDIWALGVILYQCLCGVRPFDAESLGALFFTIGADAPAPLRKHRPDLPPELDAAVMKCLEKDPAQRTQSVAELARSIAPFAGMGSHVVVSMERIHGVLSDATPFVRPGISIPDGTLGAAMLEAAARTVDDPHAPAIATPVPAVSQGSGSVPPPGNAAPAKMGGGPPYPPAGAGVHALGGGGGGISGSMSAMAKDGLATRPLSEPPAPSRGRGLLVAGIAAVVLLGGGAGVVAFGMRNTPANGVTMGTPASSAAPATQAPAAVTAEPPAPAAVPPSVTPEATVAAAPSATATADAAPSSTAKVSAPSGTKGTKPGGPKKTKDVLDKWK